MKRKKSEQHALHNSRPLILDIIDLSRGGAGFGRDEKGRAVFVPFTMPGDKVKVKLTTAKSKFAEGHILEIVETSPQRIDPPCEVFSKCGGCQWQHIPYDIQWETKHQGVMNSLALNKINIPEDISLFPAENIWHYRNRIQLRGLKDKMGFYANQSNSLVDITHCEIAHASINQAMADVKTEGESLDKPYKVELNLLLNGDVAKSWDNQHASEGFRQVNDEQNEKLKQWLSALIPDNQPIVDLYGGAGNLSASLIDRVPEIHCVDLSVPTENEQQIASHFYFHRSSVEPWLAVRCNSKSSKQYKNWTALIDPPRDGLGKNGEVIVQHLKKLNVNTVILVGCKTDPWSRDIAHFIKQGWKLEKLAVFDFFPQTYHVESAVLLTRKKTKH